MLLGISRVAGVALAAVVASTTPAWPQTITEFAINSSPSLITTGPDGNLWFSEDGGMIGRITPAGVVTQFRLTSNTYGIAPGPDGNVWFTAFNTDQIGRITPSGVITLFSLPSTGCQPWGLAKGPDGNLWFTESRAPYVGKITPDGAITEYRLPPGYGNANEITTGPDGNMWFTTNNYVIGRVTPAGAIDGFMSYANGIVAGPDGNVWFTQYEWNRIGRLTLMGGLTTFSTGNTMRWGPRMITAGPDGNLWFTDVDVGKIGRITLTGTVTEYSIPTSSSYPDGITTGPDGNIWFVERGAWKIGRLSLAPAPPVRPQSAWHSWFAVDRLETPDVGDFNGDGKTDIITFTRQNPLAVGDVYVALSDGTKFGDNVKWHDWFAITTDETVVIGDYDGDGKDDIATWLGKTTRQVYVALSYGTGMAQEFVWADSIGFDASDVLAAGDVNGDGKEDLVLFARKRGEVWVALADGMKFLTPTLWHSFFAVSTYERPRVADVTGDGMADIVTFATNSPTAQGDVYVSISDGTRFIDLAGNPSGSTKWHDWFAVQPSEQVQTGRLNADARDDFFTFLPLPWGQCYTVNSLGTALAENVLWRELVLYSDADRPFVGDVNGDGKADVIVFAQAEGKVYVSKAP